MRVLIVGGGVGGLCLAHGLQKAGIDVRVFERQESNEVNLAGYGLHIDRNGRRALRTCLPLSNWARLQSLCDSAGTQMFFRDTQLQPIAIRDDVELSGKLPCEIERSGIGRLDLRSVLLDGLTSGASPVVQWNKMFTYYEYLGDQRVRIYFEDGTCEDGDVLVGADGPNSKIRQQYLPSIKRLDLGIAAIVGRYILRQEELLNIPTGILDGSLNNIVPRGKGWMFISTWKSGPTQSDSEQGEERSVVWAYVVPQESMTGRVDQLTSFELRNHVLRATESWSPSIRDLVQGSDVSMIKCLSLRSMPPLSS